MIQGGIFEPLVRTGPGKAEGAMKIAVLGDFQNRRAGVLVVTGAKPAVKGASVFFRRHVETVFNGDLGFDPFLTAALPLPGFGSEKPVDVAGLFHIHSLAVQDIGSLYFFKTLRAEALSPG
jgi:hypothetical protein